MERHRQADLNQTAVRRAIHDGVIEMEFGAAGADEIGVRADRDTLGDRDIVADADLPAYRGRLEVIVILRGGVLRKPATGLDVETTAPAGVHPEREAE